MSNVYAQSETPISNSLGGATFCLTRIEVWRTQEFRFSRPFRDASGTRETGSVAYLRIVDEDGTEGIGYFDGPVWIEAIEQCLIPTIRRSGRIDYQEFYPALYWNVRNFGFNGPAASQLGVLDMALHDLTARRCGRSVHSLLGGNGVGRNLYASGVGVDIEGDELVRELQGYRERGFTAFKMKVGRGGGAEFERDLDRVRLAREVLGPAVELAIDANQALSVEVAGRYAERMTEHAIAWFEEPVHSVDRRRIEALCRNSPVPIAYGESECSSFAFGSLVDCGVSHLQPIVSKLAGLGEYQRIHDLAKSEGVRLSSGGPTWVAATCLAAAGPEVLAEYLVPFFGDIKGEFRQMLEIDRGVMRTTDGPGWGFELDWDGERHTSHRLLLASLKG